MKTPILLRWIRYWIPVLFVASVITYLSSRPANELPFQLFNHADKVGHFLIYAGLGFATFRALTWKLRLTKNQTILVYAFFGTIFFGAIFGLIDEYHQSFRPGRMVEGADLVANILGSAFGAGLGIAYRRFIAK